MTFISTILSVFSNLTFVAIGILGIGFLIGFHEFGHFIFCKIFNIATPTFSIGMGPRIFTKKIGETDFSLSAIPLGGYVEIKGAEEDSNENNTPDPRSFTQKPYWQKMLVISGGIVFNLFFAYFALSLLYFIGMPKSAFLYPQNASTIISSVEEDSPATKSNLKQNDTILAINGETVENNPLALINYIKNKPNQTVVLTIKRDNKEEKIDLTVGERKIQDRVFGYIGIDFLIPRYGLLKSIKLGISSTNIIIWQVWETFKSIFTKRSTENIGGPLMVISQTIQGASKGAKIFLLLLAFISINLAVLNVIPLPIMDGGQALFYTIEAIIRRPLPEQIKIYIHYACWLGVLALAIFLSIKDVIRIFWAK